MSELILIRHSLPQIDPSVPAALWNLSEEGRHRCHTLAEKLADEYDIDVIVSSAEPKAYETGCIIAKILGKPISTAEGLHEHQRKHIGLLAREEFDTRVAEFFVKSDQLVFGDKQPIRPTGDLPPRYMG